MTYHGGYLLDSQLQTPIANYQDSPSAGHATPSLDLGLHQSSA